MADLDGFGAGAIVGEEFLEPIAPDEPQFAPAADESAPVSPAGLVAPGVAPDAAPAPQADLALPDAKQPPVSAKRPRAKRADEDETARLAGADEEAARAAEQAAAVDQTPPAGDDAEEESETPAGSEGGESGDTLLIVGGVVVGAAVIGAALGGGGGSGGGGGGGPVNTAPVATADSYSTSEDTALTVAAPGLLGNDTDANGNPLTAVLVSGPTRGTLTLNANGSFVYTPNANYNGTDSFTYKVNDGTADSNTVTVNLTVNAVNDLPVAAADSYTTSEDTALTIAAPGVLANDTDVDGNALTAILVTGPANGTLTLTANGSFVYTPNANYTGADSFTYKVNDGTADGNTVTVSLTVTAVNDAPVTAADAYATNEDTVLNVAAPGVLANDSDIDGNSLTAVLVSGPANGSLTLNPDGSFAYTPNANYNGADSFTYRANDGTADGNTVTVNLTVNAVNDAPLAAADAYATDEDTTLNVGAAGVLANDTDADGNPLTAALVAGPANGTLVFNADGSFSYTPDANYNGPDSFSYKINDGSVDGNTVTVNLTVNAVNDAPVAAADFYATGEDVTVNVAAPGVLANDTDVEGDPLTAVLVAGPANGSVTLNADGSFAYTPNSNYNGADSFTYRANDGTDSGNVVTVNLTVAAINDAPLAASDAYATDEDTTLTIAAAGVLANDSDIEGDSLTAVLVSGPANGTLTLNADGSFAYTPNANYTGADSFTYRANDGTADGNTVTVNLTVNPVNDAPVAAVDAYATNEDTTLNVAAPAVLANDTDLDGNPLTAALVSGPANGTLVFNADGSFAYTPNANYNGADSFTYKVNDGTVDSNTVTVNLTVNPVNDAPVAVGEAYTVNEDTVVGRAAPGVLANDTDTEGNPLTAVLVSGPSNGTLVLNSDGSFGYLPNANFNGVDSYTYKANDGTADSNTVTVTLTVNPVNDAPVATADSYAINEDTALTVAGPGVLANDSDVEGSALSAVLVSGPANGTLTLNADGSFVYTPNANYNGPDSFTYRANDGTANGNTVVVNLTVNPVNDAPVAAPNAYQTTEDTTLNVAAPGILFNDTDVDGNPITAVLVSGPANGTLTFNADGSFAYTPNADFTGIDSFTYRANDGTTDGNVTTVSVTVNPVNDAPVATADTYSTNEDTTLNVAAPGVLANDTDVDGNPLTAALVSGPANGSLVFNADGSFAYTPNANYNGADSFTYKVNDGTVDGNTVTVSLTVNAVNDAPITAADAYATNEDTVLNVAAPGVLANDTDIDGNPLTAVLVTGPANGSLTLNPDGSFAYTPNANYNGADSFTYRANDGTANGNTVTVSLTVNAVNDAPVAAADAYATDEDTVLNVAAPGVLANDTDADGNPLTAALVSGPANGSLVFNADGSFAYTPNANYNGADSFTYKVNDGTVDGNTVTVSLTVNAVNDAPVATVDAYAALQDTALVVAAATGVLANDTDTDGDPLSAILVTDVANGTLALNLDGSFTYTPNAGYFGPDSFTYKVNDGTADGNTVTVNLNVVASNMAPVATADAYAIGEDATLNVAAAGVLANDTDADGGSLSAVLVSGPANGSLTLNADGSFAYTPNANYNGADSFTYKANDGLADSNTVTVSLTVNAVNDAPVAMADAYATNEDTTLNIAAAGVLANDTDVDGNPLTAALVSGPANGSLTLNADGSFAYTPNANYNGADSFTYKVNDGTTDGNTVTVSLTVNAVNDAPVAMADAYATNEDTTLNVAAPGVLGNDTDADGNPLTAALVSGPANGALTFNADGSFAYTPNANYNGADSFTYKVNDGTADGNTVTVSLTVNAVNDVPVATADAYATNEDTTLNIAAAGVLANDTDVDGNPLTAALVSGPANGSLTLNADGSFAYTPNANYNGSDSFTYKVNDGTTDGNTVTVSLTVNAVNDLPVAMADAYATNEDTTLNVAAPGVLGNDTDADGNPLTAALASGPANGALTFNADGSFAYTPNANYNGADSFTYKVNDGTADGNTVTVSLTVNAVNDVPVAVTDAYATNEDTTLNVAAAGVLANDTDAEGNPLTAVLVSGPANGTLTLNADGSFAYTPNSNFSGADSFTYRANDGTANGNTVTVSLTVNAVNDAPVTVADAYATNEDTPLTIAAPGVLTNDTDVDGDALSSVLVGNVSNGMLALNADGSFTYTPNANFSGSDSFTYKANDGTADGNTVTVNLTVNAVNDTPVGNDDTGTAFEDSALVVDAFSGVLANDTDVEGGPLTVSAVTGGTVGTPFELPSGALLTLNADGSYTYDTNGKFEALRPGQAATDTFSYTVSDGTASDTATATITINGQNEAPVAVADFSPGAPLTIVGNTPYTISASTLLANDTDADGPQAALTISSFTNLNHVTVRDLGGGNFEIVPETGYQGVASFDYFVVDGDGTASVAAARVHMAISGQVWYVDNTYDGSNGTPDGSYRKPFTSLNALNDNGTGVGTPGTADGIVGDDDVDGAGDTIFLYDNGPDYTAGIVLENGQTLRGDGTAFVVNGHNIGGTERTTGVDNVTTNSVIGQASGTIATLGSNNTLTGVTIGSGTGTATAISGTNFGTLTVNNAAINSGGQALVLSNGSIAGSGFTSTDSDGGGNNVVLTTVDGTLALGTGALSGATGTAFAVTGGTVTATYSGNVSQASTGQHLVGVSGGHTGTLTFSSGTLNATNGTGLNFDNADGTYTFSGTTTLSGGNAGIDIVNGSSGTFNFSTTTSITNPTGDAFELANSNANVTYNGSITASNGNAVEIDNHDAGTITFQVGSIQSTGTSAGGIDVINSNGGVINFNNPNIALSTGANTALNLTNNTGGTINFTPAAGGNGLDITTTSGAGIVFSGGGTLNVTGTGNTVTTGTGQILILQNGTMGTSGIAFQALTSGVVSGGAAITINNLDAAGAGTFSGGAVDIDGTSAFLAAGLYINNSNATFNFSSATIDNTSGVGIGISGTPTDASGPVSFTTVDIDGTGAEGILVLGATGAVNVNGGSVGATNDPALTAVSVDGGTGAVTIGAAVTKTTTGAVVLVNNHETGNVTFSGNISASGGASGVVVQNSNSGTIAFTGQTISLNTGTATGVNLTNNTGGTINFTPTTGGNGLDIVTTSGTGFNATGGGTVTVTQNGTAGQAGNTITTTTGTPLNIQNTTIGAAGVTFQSISANGAVNGIVLNSTGSSGAFTVTGDGSTTAGVLDRDGSGGTIQNTTGDGIVLTNAHNVTLRQMNLTGNGDLLAAGNEGTEATTTAGEHTIQASGGSNLILSSLLISNTGGNGVFASELGGINRINGDTLITGLVAGSGHAVYTTNTTTSAALIQLDGVDIVDSNSSFATVYVTNGGAANVRLDVKNSTFENLATQAVTAAAGSAPGTTGTMTTSISTNVFRNGRDTLGTGAATGENNVGILVNNGARHIAQVNNNLFDNIAEDGSIANTSVIRTQNSGGRMDVTVNDNIIQNITYASGGRHLIGHIFEPATYDAANFSNVSIRNNTFSNIDYVNSYREFVFVDFRPTASGGDVIIANNTGSLDPTNPIASQQGIEFRARQTNASTVDLLIEGNNLTFAATTSDIIDIDAEDGATVNATIRNNTITANGQTGDFISVAAEDGLAGGPVGTLNASITGNTLVDADGARTIELAELGGPPAGNLNVAQASAAAVQAANTGATAVNVTGAPTYGAPAPALPVAPTLPGAAPLMAAAAAPGGNQPFTVGDGVPSQGQLDVVVAAAIQRWAAAGATAEQLAAMRAVDVSTGDLAGLQIGRSQEGGIVIDNDAAGWGWFVDATPHEDSEFAAAGGEDASRMDLLTAVMHELGHQIGLDDDHADADGLMNGLLAAGERHVPEAAAGGDGDRALPQTILEQLDIATLDLGRSLASELGGSGEQSLGRIMFEPVSFAEIEGTGWQDALSPTMDFGAGDSLDGLLAGFGSRAAEKYDAGDFTPDAIGALDFANPLAFQPFAIEEVDHRVL